VLRSINQISTGLVNNYFTFLRSRRRALSSRRFDDHQDLNLVPQVVELKGFISYASPINAVGVNTVGVLS
jgi:hypothetical protein